MWGADRSASQVEWDYLSVLIVVPAAEILHAVLARSIALQWGAGSLGWREGIVMEKNEPTSSRFLSPDMIPVYGILTSWNEDTGEGRVQVDVGRRTGCRFIPISREDRQWLNQGEVQVGQKFAVPMHYTNVTDPYRPTDDPYLK